MTQALLIIDVQQGLCEGEYCVLDAKEVIGRINDASARARAVGIPVIFVQHETVTDELKFGSRQWQLADGLRAEPGDIRVRKTTPDSFQGTELLEVLRSRRVSELIICGMQTEYCVDTTTRRALALGYPVWLIADGHTTFHNGVLTARQIIDHHNVTLANIESFGPRVRAVPSDALQFATTSSAA